MAKPKKQIITTDTQLLTVLKSFTADIQAVQYDNLKESIDGLKDDVKELDESIRGNGSPGLKQDLADVRKDVDTHIKDAKDTSLATRWKIGVLAAVFLASIPACTAVYQLVEHKSVDRDVETRAMVLKIIEEAVNKPPTKTP